jgi:hypothetical protein
MEESVGNKTGKIPEYFINFTLGFVSNGKPWIIFKKSSMKRCVLRR